MALTATNGLSYSGQLATNTSHSGAPLLWNFRDLLGGNVYMCLKPEETQKSHNMLPRHSLPKDSANSHFKIEALNIVRTCKMGRSHIVSGGQIICGAHLYGLNRKESKPLSHSMERG
jgi:hypothetical protein